MPLAPKRRDSTSIQNISTILSFMGFSDIHSIVVEPTLMGGPETTAQRRDAAIENVRHLAGTF